MRTFKSGDEIWVEPFRARAFPVLRDLVVDRSAMDRIIQAGGYISVRTGSAPEANTIRVKKQDADLAFDAAACIACGACIAACPYDARFLHPDGYVDKCTFCHHRTVVGRAPACVETCPTGARTFGDLDDPRSPVAKAIHAAGKVDVLKPELGTQPKFFYLNAPFKNCLREEVHQ